MKNYTQLNQEQRYHIYAMKKVGFSRANIAAEIGVHKSTISRELNRNSGQRGYRPKQAQELAADRKRLSRNAARIKPETWSQVEQRLRLDWSPEQISGLLKREGKDCVSHERIYQHVYADKRSGGTLHTHLRCQKKRRKRYGSNDRRGKLPNRISIDERPVIVSEKKRIGDWEADTIIGKNHQQAIVSLTERKTKLTLLAKVERKTADEVEEAIIKLMSPLSKKVHTVTSDNGREFANHRSIAERLGSEFYFAHPYASWERGLNENTNGLVRQYFPKNRDFKTITDEEVEKAMERLNSRPRKTLGYKSPNEVFFSESFVALRC